MLCRTCLQVFPDEPSLEKHKTETNHGKKGRQEVPFRRTSVPTEQSMEQGKNESPRDQHSEKMDDLSSSTPGTSMDQGPPENPNLSDAVNGKSGAFANSVINSRLLFPDIATFPLSNLVQDMGRFLSEAALPKNMDQSPHKFSPSQYLDQLPHQVTHPNEMPLFPSKVPVSKYVDPFSSNFACAPNVNNLLPTEVESFINENSGTTMTSSAGETVQKQSLEYNTEATYGILNHPHSETDHMDESVESPQDCMDMPSDNEEDSKSSLRDLVSPGDVGISRVPGYGPGMYISGDLTPMADTDMEPGLLNNIKTEPTEFKQGKFI